MSGNGSGEYRREISCDPYHDAMVQAEDIRPRILLADSSGLGSHELPAIITNGIWKVPQAPVGSCTEMGAAAT
jgi:hypothetical protein